LEAWPRADLSDPVSQISFRAVCSYAGS